MRTMIPVIKDDFDNSVDATHSVKFSYQGKSYELDVCEENYQRIEDFMQDLIHAANETKRKQRQTAKPKQGRPNRSDAIRGWTARCRKWAQNNGYDIGDNGALPAEAKQRYELVEPKPVAA